jgi:hypothetical protein
VLQVLGGIANVLHIMTKIHEYLTASGSRNNRRVGNQEGTQTHQPFEQDWHIHEVVIDVSL